MRATAWIVVALGLCFGWSVLNVQAAPPSRFTKKVDMKKLEDQWKQKDLENEDWCVQRQWPRGGDGVVALRAVRDGMGVQA